MSITQDKTYELWSNFMARRNIILNNIGIELYSISEGPKTYNYIFQEWLPNSDFKLNHRPHFAVMGEKYKRNNPDSKEELWLPIKPKSR